MDELDNSCSGFLACALKLLATDVKNIENQSFFFFFGTNVLEAVCKHD